MEEQRRAKVCTAFALCFIIAIFISLIVIAATAQPQLKAEYVENIGGFHVYQVGNVYLALSPYNHNFTVYNNLSDLELDVKNQETELCIP